MGPMTSDQARDWIDNVGGSVQVTKRIEGATSIDQALPMREVSVATITVSSHSLRVIFGSPMVSRDLLYPFLVDYFISAFGDQGHPVA
jgi:hypothetical protein